VSTSKSGKPRLKASRASTSEKPASNNGASTVIHRLFCWLGRCLQCELHETQDGMGGKCIHCGKVHGWMTRDDLRNILTK
jgi:hypothetical protein